MQIEMKETEKIISVKFSGEFDMLGIKELKESLFNISDEKNKDMEIDLASASYLDSSAIGMLLTLNKRQKSKGHEIKLINVPENILKILELSSLNQIL